MAGAGSVLSMLLSVKQVSSAVPSAMTTAATITCLFCKVPVKQELPGPAFAMQWTGAAGATASPGPIMLIHYSSQHILQSQSSHPSTGPISSTTPPGVQETSEYCLCSDTQGLTVAAAP
jgi:hypothetical protein